MKKMLRRIIVLICVATIAIMPSATAMASTTSQPVLVSDNYGTSVYQFMPDPLDMQSGQVQNLIKGSDLWYVPAGKSFSFYANITYGTVQVDIYAYTATGASHITETKYTGFSYSFDPVSTDSYYLIFITSIGSAGVFGYSGMIY